MNAQTPFTLEAQPSSLLSRLDCTNDENVKDALSQLHRCATDADYVRWSRQWGENLCAAAGSDADKAEAAAELEAALTAAEKRVTTLSEAINTALKAIDALCERHDLGPKVTGEIDNVFGALERSLGE